MHERERQIVGVVLTLRGIQETAVVAHHPGSDSAVVSIRIGRALIYLHDPQAAATVARVWRQHLGDATKLPREQIRRQPAGLLGSTRAAVVVDARGSPPATGFLVQPPGHHSYLRIQLGTAVFDVRDVGAFASTYAAFRDAALLSASVLSHRGPAVSRREQAFEQVAQALPTTGPSEGGPAARTVRSPAAAPTRHGQAPRVGQRWMQ